MNSNENEKKEKRKIEQFQLEKMPVSEENINMCELLSVYCTPLAGFLVCAGKMFEWIPTYCYPIDCLVSMLVFLVDVWNGRGWFKALQRSMFTLAMFQIRHKTT